MKFRTDFDYGLKVLIHVVFHAGSDLLKVKKLQPRGRGRRLTGKEISQSFSLKLVFPFKLT